MSDEIPICVSQEKYFFVYLLECTDGSTYVGATVDLNHRLRQHNKEIKGGAHATSTKVAQGHSWRRVCHIAGFPTWQCALQFEWALKFYSRKLNQRSNPLRRRLTALKNLLNLEQSTSKSIPYIDYGNDPENPGPKIVWEKEGTEAIYLSI
jgi:structure-specific endonuclease subunit SLX1